MKLKIQVGVSEKIHHVTVDPKSTMLNLKVGISARKRCEITQAGLEARPHARLDGYFKSINTC